MRQGAVRRPTTAVVGQTKEGRQAQGQVQGQVQGQARGACQARGRQAQGRQGQAQGQA